MKRREIDRLMGDRCLVVLWSNRPYIFCQAVKEGGMLRLGLHQMDDDLLYQIQWSRERGQRSRCHKCITRIEEMVKEDEMLDVQHLYS